jgi:hypothetical protein
MCAQLQKAAKVELGEGNSLMMELLQWATQRHAVLEAERARSLTQLKHEALAAQKQAEAEAMVRLAFQRMEARKAANVETAETMAYRLPDRTKQQPECLHNLRGGGGKSAAVTLPTMVGAASETATLSTHRSGVSTHRSGHKARRHVALAGSTGSTKEDEPNPNPNRLRPLDR